MIFVGCASRSPVAYERGINYPGASVWSLLRSLFASFPFHLTSFPLSLSLPLSDYLIPPVPAITPRCRSFISLVPTAGVSVMTPPWWDDTGSEVRTAEPRRSLNGKFELHRRGAALRWLYTLALSCARRKIRFFRSARSHSRVRESRASSCRGKVAPIPRGGLLVECVGISERAN